MVNVLEYVNFILIIFKYFNSILNIIYILILFLESNSDYCLSPLEFDLSCTACRPGFEEVPDCDSIIDPN